VFDLSSYLSRNSGKLTVLNKQQAPDPAEWCQRGYAIVNVDARGAGHSEGDIVHWGDQVCSQNLSWQILMLTHDIRKLRIYTTSLNGAHVRAGARDRLEWRK
jgi:hypothetical protein